MKMMVWVIGLLMIGVTAARAIVTLDFSYDTLTYTTRLRDSTPGLTFVFSIDGSGAVTLDASTTDGDPEVIALVDSWDGNVGTVADASLWGTAFTLQAKAYSVVDGDQDLMYEPDQTGGLGVYGSNGGRIDGWGVDPEHVEFTLTDGYVMLNFSEVNHVGASSGSDFYVTDGTASHFFYNVGESGTSSISGLSLANGGVLSIGQPDDSGQLDLGIALGGLSFTVNAIGGGTPSNLIANGSLETGTSAGWSVGSPSEALVVSNTASDGSYALKLESTDGAVAEIGQTIPVQSNTDYVFTHAIHFTAGSTGTVTARLTFDNHTLKVSTSDPTAGWVTKETRFNSGDATEITLDIYAGDFFTGPVYVDDFVVEQLIRPFRYETWAGAHGLGPADDDQDADGLNNLYEFVFAGNPTNPADTGTGLTFDIASNALALSHVERNDDIYLQSNVEVCANLVNGNWVAVDSIPVTTGTTGAYDVVVSTIALDAPKAYFRVRVETRTETYTNDGYYELVPSGTADDRLIIQDALDQLQDGDTLRLTGDFFIFDTIYLPSNFKWELDGTLSLADNADDNLDEVGWYEELNDANNNIIDARRRTGISEKPGGASNIEMSGGTYSGNAAGNPASLRFINFVSVTDSIFHDMLITDVSDDNFTLGPGCSGNICSNLVGSFSITGNALTDKGDHNKWYDCIAEDCGSDGWTPKCRYSEFHRCIGRRNEGPGFGMYVRIDGSGNPDDLGETIEGNRFYACQAYENDREGFSFDISSTSGEGGTVRNNYVEGIAYSNRMQGVFFRNKQPNSVIENNEVNIVAWGNLGQRNDGSLSSFAGGLGIEATYPVTGITGSVVCYDNVGWDVNTYQGTGCNITAYHPTGESAPVLKKGDASNIITVIEFDCLVDPLVEWCMQAYCDLVSQ